LNANFQFSQKTHFKSPRSGADHLFTNIESYFNHVFRQNSKLWPCQTEPSKWICKQILQKS